MLGKASFSTDNGRKRLRDERDNVVVDFTTGNGKKRPRIEEHENADISPIRDEQDHDHALRFDSRASGESMS